ncbi:effector-associated constant component EACC1 [Nocardia sp. BMG111209]|uniref:effector-associated constant component EACC1 n=1 Tax=Nocardia sp. BMG111209 TaxID=1160137 RepID=UPI0003636C76|nr:hypothetical protein [Nocardia sp. BMG111209]
MTIRADSGPDELPALLDWFGREDALRGRVRPVATPAGEGHGTSIDVDATRVDSAQFLRESRELRDPPDAER